MTETDATRKPLQMPEKFIPYLEQHRIYKLFKDMMQDLIINLPKDHLKHMKIFLLNRMQSRDVNNIMILVSPDIKIDMDVLVKNLIKYHGFAVLTRRYVMDKYEKHDEYVPGCLSPELLSKVTKNIVTKHPVPINGWLMFDHPRTFREARCLQQDGILPTVTLLLTTKQHSLPPEQFLQPVIKNMFQQDYEGLKFAYKATAKVIHILPREDDLKIYRKCVNGIQACASGAQGEGQGFHVLGAPGVYRVLLIGARGSGRHTQARITAKHFGLVFLKFDDLFAEALQIEGEFGDNLRRGASAHMRFQIVKRRLLQRDCIDNGWILTGYPNSVNEFESLFSSDCSPNRVIFLNVSWDNCKARLKGRGIDPCTGLSGRISDPGIKPDPKDADEVIDSELEMYFLERHAELRAKAGSTAVDINGEGELEQVQTAIQAAVIASPTPAKKRCCPK